MNLNSLNWKKVILGTGLLLPSFIFLYAYYSVSVLNDGRYRRGEKEKIESIEHAAESNIPILLGIMALGGIYLLADSKKETHNKN
jgi:hypothetical protein